MSSELRRTAVVTASAAADSLNQTHDRDSSSTDADDDDNEQYLRSMTKDLTHKVKRRLRERSSIAKLSAAKDQVDCPQSCRWRKPQQEVPGTHEKKVNPLISSDTSLLLIFHSKFLEIDSPSTKDRVQHFLLDSYDFNELCDYIQKLVIADIADTNYEIKHIFIKNRPGDDTIDIYKIITNQEHLEDCNKVMELTKTNSELKVVAEYIPAAESTEIKVSATVENLMKKFGETNCFKMMDEAKATTEVDEALIGDGYKNNDPSTNSKDQEPDFQEPNALSLMKQKRTVVMKKSLCTDLSNTTQTMVGQDKFFKNFDKYESDESIFASDTESSKIHFVGLVNQAMTCYLNSLLQALYMTPEFRNALYTWEYTGTEKEATNIPFQLQKLFLNLQTSGRSVETTALTQSFGWDSTEAWNQHDIQELCRVMFDALEKTFKTTKHPDFINRLYEGKILDYVKCLTCNLEKSREDSFLDIPLPLRSFDGSVTYGSVEEALEAFIKYETLEGNNQYFCEKCNKKSNAHKGLKFSKFPYILTLQLKRFDFDHNTFHRIKLNDKVTFPDKLNLNLFIASNQETPSQDDAESNGKGVDIAADESSTDAREESSNMPLSNNSNHLSNSNHDQDDDEGIEMCNGLSAYNDIDKMREHYAKAIGPYIYELFCIMIHSGSANGGHYYAYIKDFRNNKWWCFDDQRVSPITEKDIQNTYGGGSGRTLYYSSQYRSSTNAYMLMYRQIDNKRNVLPIEAENFPPHLKSLVERMTLRCEGDNNYGELETHEQKIRLDILFRRPEDQELDQLELVVSGPLIHTVGQIAAMAFKKADFKGSPDPDRIRIVYYNKKYNLVERVLHSDMRIDTYMDQYPIKDLMLEVVQPNEEFEPHPSDPIVTKVYLVNPKENELIDGPKYVRAYAEQSIREYKQQLKKYFNIDPEVVQLMIPEILPNELMKDDEKFEGNISGTYPYKVIATEFYNTCKEKKFQYSDYLDMSSRLIDTVTFYIDSSNVSEKTLNLLKIPSLQNYYVEEKSRDSASNHNHLSEELSKIHVSPDKSKSTSCEGIDAVSSQFILHDKDRGNLWNFNYGEPSNSEDSSLSDSDKTIVNEDVTENAVMLDEEAQSYVSTKSFDTQQPLFNKTTNGALPACDVIFKIEYLKKEKLWLVTKDKEMTEYELKERLEPYIKVPKNYFKVTVSPPDSPYCSQPGVTVFRDDRKYTITLGRVLQPNENSIEIFALRMGDSQALQKLLETGVNMNCCIRLAKHQIYSELRKIGCVDVPFERLRFAEVNGSCTVSEELKDSEMPVRFITNICVQVLPPSDNHESSNHVQVYVRRWNRSKMQLDDPQEISVPKSTFSKDLIKQVSEISSISEECLEFNLQVVKKELTLTKMDNFEWKTEVLLPEVDFRTYVIYRDSKEIPKEENDKTDWYYKRERYSNPLTGVPYARREKALKIHVDT
ncbi:ubiquitin carboxyl-terminal hydrolase 47 isoform X2 [Copidosoma floridanum]|uniref:ubiquitin carboxyl-terminal hydrolase 47 isoform X2 n=1 Tax=Copidosoma floridanum TaxID=29053 RepID=UPI000C6F9A13|nr:ubiquitin carboxyl-terminal hydrolase 47 isoform X2 [Copidosoma floridanum]